ncbi:MAG: ABC transporter permease [Anaerolineae bacterium]|nr:ABC transporter permease [Anaerolineae bacterium]
MNTATLRQNARAVLAVAEMSFRQNVMDLFIIFTVLIQPLLVALLALWMLADKGPDYIIFVVVGSGMTGLWSGLLFICGNSINAERWSGTLETMVGVPTPLALIVIGKNLANVGQSLVSMASSYLLAVLIFGYDVHIAMPLHFIVSLALTVVAFISFGMIIAPVFVMNPGVQQFQNAMEFPVFILSGFLFPIALLPGWSTPLSYLLPTYWAAQAMHLSSSGGAAGEIFFAWGMMLAFSLVYLFIASILFRVMLVKARTDATLDME